MRSQQQFKRAVLIGGSIAGLVGARVLADHFEQVVLLERDPRPTGPEPRKGAPQARHIHALLGAGVETLESFFPGLVRELTGEGAVLVDVGRDGALFQAGLWKKRYVVGIQTVLCTRTFLEWKIRGRTAALPNVEIRYETSAEALLSDEARTRVTGVRVKKAGGEEELLEADLVVDASGRGSRAPRWLEQLGYAPPEVEEVGIDLAYSSRLYEPPADASRDWKLLIVYPNPPGSSRAGIISSVEGGRWIVTLSGYFGEHPPTDDEGFLAFTRTLATPHVTEALAGARPLSEAVRHKVPSSRWLHYETLKRLPESFILFGDAVCAFNPIYGQGMSVTSLCARLLGEQLTAHARASPGSLQGFSQRFQRELAELLTVPWKMSTTMDLKYPQTQGARYFGMSFVQWGFDAMIGLAAVTGPRGRPFYEMLHMMRGAEAMMSPAYLAALVGYGLKRRFVPADPREVERMPRAPS
jgi:2-polyprenyl-6-methoxyphenol hydroxylase-like FAD-dependent oxidoreductase